jgi:hypothetical protein
MCQLRQGEKRVTVKRETVIDALGALGLMIMMYLTTAAYFCF